MAIAGWMFIELDARTRPEVVIAHGAGEGQMHVAITSGVERPGVYALPDGSRLADLLDAAGGPDGTADLAAVNLAARLEDGQMINLPTPMPSTPESGVTGDASVIPAMGLAVTDPRIDLNTASLEALDGLPGIGPVLAKAIIDERERVGGFGAVDDLVEIEGISQRMVDEMRPFVTVSP